MSLLEFGGDINCQSPQMLQSQVLGFIFGGVIIKINLILSSEVVLIFGIAVGSQVYAGLYMSDEHWVVGFDYFSLHFESHVGVDMVNHPHSVESLLGA